MYHSDFILSLTTKLSYFSYLPKSFVISNRLEIRPSTEKHSINTVMDWIRKKDARNWKKEKKRAVRFYFYLTHEEDEKFRERRSRFQLAEIRLTAFVYPISDCELLYSLNNPQLHQLHFSFGVRWGKWHPRWSMWNA